MTHVVGLARRSVSAIRAAASIRCSQLSSTRRTRLAPRAAARRSTDNAPVGVTASAAATVTDETVAAVERFGKTLDLRAEIIPRWGEVRLAAGDGDAEIVSARAADPTGVDMHRVVSAMCVADDLVAGRIAPPAVRAAVRSISQAPPGPTWLFVLAAAAGAAALAVLFGVQHLAAVALIVVSAASGAVVRRAIVWYSANALLQPLCAGSLASSARSPSATSSAPRCASSPSAPA